MIRCPLCHSSLCRRVLDQYEVILRKEGEASLGGLSSYLCDRGHVFFVRATDCAPDPDTEEAA